MANTINIDRLKNIILKNSATHAEFMTITSMLLAYMVPNDTTPNNTHNKPNHNGCCPHIGSYSYNLVGQHCHGSSLYNNGTLTHEGTNSHDHSDSLIKLFGTLAHKRNDELRPVMQQLAQQLNPDTRSTSPKDNDIRFIHVGTLRVVRDLLNIAADRMK
ncbi:hypothetical protein ACVSUJ_07260 [Yersinia enterocolitica]|uniref:hypothetical protein n=1 Tax=Yersinia enterocolitica TaxID=630 RepID=UPI001CA58B63|nr:hypothetical protein [Yersinia enterocolitica]MBW5870622.1 hypothetical protein [Yersinia enterocolitica]